MVMLTTTARDLLMLKLLPLLRLLPMPTTDMDTVMVMPTTATTATPMPMVMLTTTARDPLMLRLLPLPMPTTATPMLMVMVILTTATTETPMPTVDTTDTIIK